MGDLFLSAFCIRRDRPRPNDTWQLDEVAISIRSKKHWLGRAIDANGNVLHILVQTRRNGRAAKRVFQRLITWFGEPRVVITGKLRRHIKQIKTLAPDTDHRAHKGLNNAIEGSHRPIRKREKMFGRFKSHFTGAEISERTRSSSRCCKPQLPDNGST